MNMPIPSVSENADAEAASKAVEERALWDAWRIDKSRIARERLVSLHLPYARALAGKVFRRRAYDDIEFGDLYQFACVGLLESVDRYDPDLGAGFRTFCTLRVEGAMRNGMEKLTESQQQLSLRRRIKKERAASFSQPDAPIRGKSAFEDLCEAAVGLAIGFMLEDTTMYVDEGEGEEASTPYSRLEWQQLKRQLLASMDLLPEQDKKVLSYHYLQGLDFVKIADLLNLSKGRISQIHRSALASLRKTLQDDRDFSIMG